MIRIRARVPSELVSLAESRPGYGAAVHAGIVAVSTQFVMMLNSPATERYDLSSLRILFRCALHLPQREFDAHLRQHLPGVFETEIAGLFHHLPPYNL